MMSKQEFNARRYCLHINADPDEIVKHYQRYDPNQPLVITFQPRWKLYPDATCDSYVTKKRPAK